MAELTFHSRDRIRGMFLGVAIGDALGVPVETYDAARIEREFGRMAGYVRNPTHKWSASKPAGMWSDDTQLTLAVAESIAETGHVDLESQARWHLRLLDEYGDLGLGGSTRDALARLRAGVLPTESGKSDNPKRGMGNALPMKCAAVGALAASPNFGIMYRDSWESLTYDVVRLAHMTHATDVGAISAVAHVAALRHCLLARSDPEQGLPDAVRASLEESAGFGPETPGGRGLRARLDFLQDMRGALRSMSPAQWDVFLGGDRFHVAFTLPYCYGMFLRGPATSETLADAIAGGGDTDTNASIVGGMLGAAHGTGIFPPPLVEGLAHRERILDTAERLCDRLGIEE